MIKEFRYAWRRLRGQCLVCKKKKENHRDCYHCSNSNLYCHFCNKKLMFAGAYSMGPDKMAKVLGLKK